MGYGILALGYGNGIRYVGLGIGVCNVWYGIGRFRDDYATFQDGTQEDCDSKGVILFGNWVGN